ncbi:unnamed protein product [Protopolystoma xenopodis]|uniref:Uncharacterized protein n=1 Tax=Protopolystoma xenopodis TaxID=117903 RepID=A0A3S5ANC5_9PLAT|nr:unnamed protein product [Protopolystoma xenopodis]
MTSLVQGSHFLLLSLPKVGWVENEPTSPPRGSHQSRIISLPHRLLRKPLPQNSGDMQHIWLSYYELLLPNVVRSCRREGPTHLWHAGSKGEEELDTGVRRTWEEALRQSRRDSTEVGANDEDERARSANVAPLAVAA